MQIVGLAGLTGEQIESELENGAKFVLYTYTISVLVMTFKRASDIHFIRGGESRFTRGLKYSALTFLLGWWGIPWGPVYALTSIGGNLAGGKDVTDAVLADLGAAATKRQARAKAVERSKQQTEAAK